MKEASETDLSNHGDVCSICYQEMETPDAVITGCQHFFHKHCLKKWLVVQDNCPLCTKPIVTVEEEELTENLPLASEPEPGEDTEESEVKDVGSS